MRQSQTSQKCLCFIRPCQANREPLPSPQKPAENPTEEDKVCGTRTENPRTFHSGSNKCHASSNRCLTSSNKKLLETRSYFLLHRSSDTSCRRIDEYFLLPEWQPSRKWTGVSGQHHTILSDIRHQVASDSPVASGLKDDELHTEGVSIGLAGSFDTVEETGETLPIEAVGFRESGLNALHTPKV